MKRKHDVLGNSRRMLHESGGDRDCVLGAALENHAFVDFVRDEERMGRLSLMDALDNGVHFHDPPWEWPDLWPQPARTSARTEPETKKRDPAP